jgi:hypothetical protein
MGIPVLILGESGSGKTFAIKNMDPEKVGVFLVEKPRLPFRKEFRCKRNATYLDIMKTLADPKLKQYVIDDSQYIMANEYFDRASEKGYDKFVDIGANFRNLVHLVNNELPDDVIVYFLHHPETDSNTGRLKAKTIGKMLDEKLTLEGCFDIVLHARTDGAEHWFSTQSDGTDTAKSPEEMFEAKIPNDLAFVDKTIREYYGMESV